MKPNDLGLLIRYIAFEISDDGGQLFRTRLIKLLYLIDVDYFRITRKTLSGLNWIRYKRGPYSFDIQTITKSLGIYIGEEELDFSGGKGFKIMGEEPPDPERWLDATQISIVNNIIERWGTENLDTLLDYVYCFTEPMQDAQYLEELDFRKIPRKARGTSIPEISLNKKLLEQIRAKSNRQETISRKPRLLKRSSAKSGGDEPSTPRVEGKIKSNTDKIEYFGDVEC